MPDKIEQFLNTVGSAFTWHEVYGGTTQGLLDFYTGVLGWKAVTYPMEGGDYTILEKDGHAIAGVVGNNTPGMENVPPHWATYITVDDVDARLTKCVELGGSLVHGPMDVPTVGRMVLVKDPFGATFWLFKPLPPSA
jgi:predicted enzyme related to lactoylglutathione lyase